MPHIFKGFILIITVTVGLLGCSATEPTTVKSEGSSGLYPAWYAQSGFSSDSISYHGFATAVSSDSVIAIANAELQARVNLESHIAELFEEERERLMEEGSIFARNTDFIITLRNAHNEVQSAATSKNRSASNEEGYYRGFTQVTITKSKLQDLMRSGFSGKTSYWEAIKETTLFTQ